MSIFEERRELLLNQMEDNSLLFVFSSRAPYASEDEKYHFEVNRNFYYLTNLEIENAVLVLRRMNNKSTVSLFIERYDEVLAKWVGGRILPNEATEISGITNIQYIDELDDTIGSYMRYLSQGDVICYFNFNKQELSQPDNEEQLYAKKLKVMYPHIHMQNDYGMLASMRMEKSSEEVENISKAIEITKKGIESMMLHSKPGMYEYQLENYFNFALLDEGCRKFAFDTIAASGKNATVLHYSENNTVMQDNTLILFDLGASYKNYCADISRTFPVNGKFTQRQKEVYQAVLECNEYIISQCHIGTTLAKLNQLSVEFLDKKCAELGLLKEGKTIRDYYFHSIGHMLGLDTHDVSISNYVLREGNILTVEPGLYIEDESIGVRIEDDVLITKDGPVVLSKDIIKSVEDIESFMSVK